ncbi:hypothetical protein BCJMU51_3029 [Bacillus cereus]|uniref:HNH endonuclease n=1 Tax=Bacillus cereus group TaxID=86661 RepID=UPI00027A278C|nr:MULTISPECIES: HNH endonuclease [Bacillus cereus group]EJR50710.1 hypothetical protein IIK_01779 [Bacillus cereus VD102]OUA64579.1 HNH endonuclease [Bacillus thuringiensis serovar thailandensis]MDA1844850.1 HNH endonuclease [Bacillus cereus]MDF9581483.1 HNH endonuclease [Bacillus paranthracis]MDG1617581.1 HNH endonuclease [Bacillus paranthracis]
MAIYNAFADAANTSVRAFLTKVGEYYLGSTFNTGKGNGKIIWKDIKENIFNGKCAYCGQKPEKLQIEHIIMFNKKECGLHHPGNIIPCCAKCNTRKKENGSYVSWQEHLIKICNDNGDVSSIKERTRKIKQHMEEGKYKYPKLSEEEKKAILVIANRLYEYIKLENTKCLDLYQDLQNEFLK